MGISPKNCVLYLAETEILYVLKGQCHEIFCFWFFHESVSPKALSIPLGPFRIFSKIREDIRSLPPVSTTPVANLPPVSTTPAANFATSFTSVVDTGGKQWD
jgi:hypothetical protein